MVLNDALFSAVSGALTCPLFMIHSKLHLGDPSLPLLGQLTGLSDAPTRSPHSRRLRRRNRIVNVTNTLLIILLLIPFAAALVGLSVFTLNQIATGQARGFVFWAWLVLLTAVYWPGVFLLSRIAAKLAAIVVDRSYADTICIAAVLYLLIDLSRDGILSDPRLRTILLQRIRALANWTLLLPLRYLAGGPGISEQVREHFRRIERYIREREMGHRAFGTHAL
jgi:hypothetical protein